MVIVVWWVCCCFIDDTVLCCCCCCDCWLFVLLRLVAFVVINVDDVDDEDDVDNDDDDDDDVEVAVTVGVVVDVACVVFFVLPKLSTFVMLLLAVVVDVATSCFILIFSALPGVLLRFSGTTDVELSPDVCDICLFFVFAHFSQSSVSGESEIKFGHALHVVHNVSINCAKLSSSFMRNGDGILTFWMETTKYILNLKISNVLVSKGQQIKRVKLKNICILIETLPVDLLGNNLKL